MRKINVINDKKNKPVNFNGEVGHITEEMIRKYAEAYKNRKYYISGASPMVESFKKTLLKSGIKRTKIITDYFPGY